MHTVQLLRVFFIDLFFCDVLAQLFVSVDVLVELAGFRLVLFPRLFLLVLSTFAGFNQVTL